MTEADRIALRAIGMAVPDEAKLLPAGSAIVAFEMEDRAIPWKAPHTTRTGHSYKDKSLVAWQEKVAEAARKAMRGRKPYQFAVEVVIEFVFKEGGVYPDTSNATKAFEDAMQGIVYVNDKQVAHNDARRSFADFDRVSVWCYATGGIK